MSDGVQRAPGALGAVARLALAFAAYVATAGPAGTALGAEQGGPVEPMLLAHGAGCVAFCTVGLLLPPSATVLPAHGIARAPLAWAAFMLLWAPITMFAYPWLLDRLAVDFEPQPHLAYFAGADAGGLRFVAVLAVVVAVGPLAEELAFRGWLRDVAHAWFGERAALLIVAALFGMMHGMVFALPVALLGLLFGWLRERYASLAPSFAAHVLHNAVTVAVAMRWPQVLDEVYR